MYDLGTTYNWWYYQIAWRGMVQVMFTQTRPIEKSPYVVRHMPEHELEYFI
jgi:hypothetical protein